MVLLAQSASGVCEMNGQTYVSASNTELDDPASRIARVENGMKMILDIFQPLGSWSLAPALA